MNKEFTVSICIPAFNEQFNIDRILRQLLKQKQEGFVINKIIVASDGSTDKTVKIVKKYKNRGVKVIAGKANRGQAFRQNELISKTNADILVLMNADLLLGDNKVISRLIEPIIRGADLSAQWAKPIAPHSILERILCAGYELKNYVYTHHNNGNNIYTCVGHIRAFSRKFYSNVKFPTNSDGEDQYLYLACLNGGYRYEYTKSVNLYFKFPNSFSEYKIYAKRIFQTQKKFSDVFNEHLVSFERKLPFLLKLKACIFAFLKQPLYTPLYIILHLAMQKWSMMQPVNSYDVFEVSNSTKNFDNKSLTKYSSFNS